MARFTRPGRDIAIAVTLKLAVMLLIYVTLVAPSAHAPASLAMHLFGADK